MSRPPDPGGAAVEYAFFGPGARFHHIGLGVSSIRAVSPSSAIMVEPTQRVSLAFVRLHGITVELLEPYGSQSPISRSVREGVRLLHLCFEVPDLDAALAACRPAGFHRLSRPVPALPFDDRRIVWVFSEDSGLFELAEAPAAAQVSHAPDAPR